jgi:hypothetical protein
MFDAKIYLWHLQAFLIRERPFNLKGGIMVFNMMHTIRHQCIYRFNTCYPESYMPIHGYFGGTASLKTYSDLYSKSSTNNHRYNYYMENKMTSTTYLCVFKMFDAKIYLWHLQAFLISGAKIKKINYILIEV